MTNHPKIGIRPIIDGRRGGIRESLEEMTMGMALSVAKLYAAKLRYADGAPVECVIATRRSAAWPKRPPQPTNSATTTSGPSSR